MLKKLTYIIAIIFTLILVGYQNAKPLFSSYQDNFEVYIGSSSSTAKIITVGKTDYPFMKRIKGESVKICANGFDAYQVFEDYNAQIIFIETVGDTVCYYGYSKDIKYLEVIGGRKINLQVAITGNSVTVGSPIIYGSF